VKQNNYTVEYVASSIITDIKSCKILKVCKNFKMLHDHCDANVLGCSEELLDAMDTEKAIDILNAAQSEVNLWLIANSIANQIQPQWDSTDVNVECHSAAFKIKHGRNANWDIEEAVCDELWFDTIYLKLRVIVKTKTGK